MKDYFEEIVGYEDIKKECEEITKKMQEGDPEYNRLCDIICAISIKDIKGIYDDLDVSFDFDAWVWGDRVNVVKVIYPNIFFSTWGLIEQESKSQHILNIII